MPLFGLLKARSTSAGVTVPEGALSITTSGPERRTVTLAEVKLSPMPVSPLTARTFSTWLPSSSSNVAGLEHAYHCSPFTRHSKVASGSSLWKVHCTCELKLFLGGGTSLMMLGPATSTRNDDVDATGPGPVLAPTARTDSVWVPFGTATLQGLAQVTQAPSSTRQS